MNVNDGSVVCPTCGSGTLGYSAMKHAQRAERAGARIAALEGVLLRIRAYADERVDGGWEEHGDEFRLIRTWCDEVVPSPSDPGEKP